MRLKRLVWRAGYEVWQRSGAAALRDPAPRAWPVSDAAPDRARWLEGLEARGAGRWWTRARRALSGGAMGQSLATMLHQAQRDAIIQRAEQAGRGTIRGFGHLPMELGWPVDWHRARRPGERWSADIHHSRALSEMARCGDVKWTWEISRSPHVFDWVRASALDPSGPHGERLGGFFESFVAQCAWGCGVHWASGQEVALRVMTWMWAASLIDPGERGWRALLCVMGASGRHLVRHIGFARRAVPNNHLIAEALALWMLGALCWWDDQAPRWVSLGRAALFEAVDAQFSADGGYCQSSHNYHRFALQLLLWAHCIFGEEDRELYGRCLGIFERSSRYFMAQMDAASGRVPAWGALDGAMFNPWTECDFGDMRPVVGAMRRAVSGQRAFEPGPWDEEALWLFGPAPDARPAPRAARSIHTPQSGLVTRRFDGGTFGVLRCGPHVGPFGQADLGHVNLWWRGREVVCDIGSYCYNEDDDQHMYFHGPDGHNMPRIEDADAGYRRLGRWSWVVTPRGRGALLPDGQLVAWWRADGVFWERRVTTTARGWRVTDRARGLRGREVRCRWTLGDGVRVAASASAGQLELVASQGQRSRRYLELEAAPVVAVRLSGCGDVVEIITELICEADA